MKTLAAIVLALVIVIAWEIAENAHQAKLAKLHKADAEHYAKLVVICANAGDFTLDGEWLIRCRRRKMEEQQ